MNTNFKTATHVGRSSCRPSRRGRPGLRSAYTGSDRGRRLAAGRTRRSAARGSCPYTPPGSRTAATSSATTWRCPTSNSTSSRCWRSTGAATRGARRAAADCLQPASYTHGCTLFSLDRPMYACNSCHQQVHYYGVLACIRSVKSKSSPSQSCLLWLG